MRKIMNLKFNKNIQGVLNRLFEDEEYTEYRLKDMFKILLLNFGAVALALIISFAR